MILIDIERVEELRQEAIDEGMKRLSDNSMAPRERLSRLVDPGSFVELGQLARSQQPAAASETPTDGVITGYGEVSGRKAVVVVEDRAMLAKTDRQVAKEKVRRILGKARLENLPIVYCLDTPASAPQLFEYSQGLLFGNMAEQKEVPSLATHPRACIFGVFGELQLEQAAFIQNVDIVVGVQPRDSHPTEQDIRVDIRCPNEESALSAMRRVMEMLPAADEILDEGENLLNLSGAQEVDPETELRLAKEDILPLIFADEEVLRFTTESNSGIQAGLGMLAEIPVCAVGPVNNEAMQLTTAGLETLYRIARLCRRVKLPLLLVQNCSGYSPGQGDMNEYAQKLASFKEEMRNIQAPKLSLVVGDGHVLGSFAFGGRELGMHHIAAWPWAKIGLSDVDSYKPEVLDACRENDAWLAAGRGMIDSIVLPSETRNHVVALLRFLVGMRGLSHDIRDRMLRDF